jgi:hypothetical protein
MEVKPFIVSRRPRPGAERGTHMEMFKGSAFISQTHESPERNRFEEATLEDRLSVLSYNGPVLYNLKVEAGSSSLRKVSELFL